MDHTQEKQGATYPQAHEMQNQPPMYHQSSPPPQQGYQQGAPTEFQQGPPQAYQQQQYQSSPPLSNQATGQTQYFPPQGQQVPQHAAQSPPPQQQGAPVQTQSQQRQFQNATPIANLARGPAPVDCPACGQRAMTQIQYHVGNSTHAWALGLCVCLCLGCIPYLLSSLKDVEHKCGKCGVLLATWHRSGSTEVHIHS